MRRSLNILMLFVLALALNGSLIAQPGNGGPGGGGGNGGPGMHEPGFPPFWNQLTPEQRAILQALIQSLHERGATPVEIRDAVHAQLIEWGITPPEEGGGGNGGPGNPPHPPFWNQLTPEQQATLQALIQSLHESGATPMEIHDAIQAQLLEWGITPPEEGGGGNGGHHGHPPFWSQLTPEQQATLQALIESLHDSGATMEEIHAAVQAQLTEWGIELPPPGAGGNGNHPPFWSQLTIEQRHQLQVMIRDMRHAGATPEEIRAAVDALLLEWGISGPLQEAMAQDDQSVETPANSMAPEKLKAFNYPNPFNPTTTINYTLEAAGPVSITIYDMQGREIRNLVNAGYKAAGQYQVIWDALDNHGSTVVSGAYLMRVSTNGQAITQHLVYMK